MINPGSVHSDRHPFTTSHNQAGEWIALNIKGIPNILREIYILSEYSGSWPGIILLASYRVLGYLPLTPLESRNQFAPNHHLSQFRHSRCILYLRTAFAISFVHQALACIASVSNEMGELRTAAARSQYLHWNAASGETRF